MYGHLPQISRFVVVQIQQLDFVYSVGSASDCYLPLMTSALSMVDAFPDKSRSIKAMWAILLL
jgi:hypothetical protein